MSKRSLNIQIYGFLVIGWIAGCMQPDAGPRSDAATRAPDSKTAAPTSTDDTDDAGPGDRPRVVDYTPQIRIDYSVPQVEVRGVVGLRRGALELFAYSRAPVPKEHETIVVLDAEPLRIHEALGLIGLAPGKPMQYFPETGEVRLPSGDPVDVFVRYSRDGEVFEDAAWDWMMDLAAEAPLTPRSWVFAGSQRTEDGRFAANVEGTVATVVNFTSALLALPADLSDVDSELWLGAKTEAIPPEGTAVTLILRPGTPQ